MVGKAYDSARDIRQHQEYVLDVLMMFFIHPLFERAQSHDLSMFEEPEKSIYDKYKPEFEKFEYGTIGYNEIIKKIQEETGNRHVLVNRHHPQHFEGGVADMTLIDFVEMVADIFAESLRSKESFLPFLKKVADDYHLPSILVDLILNTYTQYFSKLEIIIGKRQSPDEENVLRDIKLGIYENHDRGLFDKETKDYLLGNLYHYNYLKEKERRENNG